MVCVQVQRTQVSGREEAVLQRVRDAAAQRREGGGAQTAQAGGCWGVEGLGGSWLKQGEEECRRLKQAGRV